MRFVPVLLVLLLVACGDDPAPVATEDDAVTDGQVLVHIWQREGMDPLVLDARRARQDIGRPEQVDLMDVSLRLPLRDGEVLLRTDRAALDLDEGQRIDLHPPVMFNGTFQGMALVGRAEGARVFIDRRELVLDEMDLLYAAQHLRVDRMTIQNDWLTRSAERLRSRPTSAPVTGALATLPKPLAFVPTKVKGEVKGGKGDTPP